MFASGGFMGGHPLVDQRVLAVLVAAALQMAFKATSPAGGAEGSVNRTYCVFGAEARTSLAVRPALFEPCAKRRGSGQAVRP